MKQSIGNFPLRGLDDAVILVDLSASGLMAPASRSKTNGPGIADNERSSIHFTSEDKGPRRRTRDQSSDRGDCVIPRRSPFSLHASGCFDSRRHLSSPDY